MCDCEPGGCLGTNRESCRLIFNRDIKIMRVGDKVAWRNQTPERLVTILWIPTLGSQRGTYTESMALVDWNGCPRLVPIRVLMPPPGPCRANVTLNLAAEPVYCRHHEGHTGVHEATVGISPLISLHWRS